MDGRRNEIVAKSQIKVVPEPPINGEKTGLSRGEASDVQSWRW